MDAYDTQNFKQLFGDNHATNIMHQMQEPSNAVVLRLTPIKSRCDSLDS